MTKLLLLTIFIFACTGYCYAQNILKDTVYLKDVNGIIHQAILHKTDDGWYYYETSNIDSSKYFYHRYLLLKEKGVPDTMNHWYYKLSNKK